MARRGQAAPSPDPAANCPERANHTPHPSGYLAHAEWAERMLTTHEQRQCAVCGLWAVWVPRRTER
jgi:hypothetical protein